jgi:hypothetical protein
MVTRLELICGAIAVGLVTTPLIGWIEDLANGKMVDVAGPWWVLWLAAHTMITGWWGTIIYRLMR